MSAQRNEKHGLLDAPAVDAGPKALRTRPFSYASLRRLVAGSIVASLCILAWFDLRHDSQLLFGRTAPSLGHRHAAQNAPTCPQVMPLKPRNETLLGALYESFASEVFRDKAAGLLGAAVRIPTETYDMMGKVGEDERWDKFAPFHVWLEGAFPAVHSTLKKETVNTWGLVFTWEGSDPSLKPLMLTAHQDVVPVPNNTLDQWEQPPFSGYFDGKWIWGRGSCDDKGGLVGIMIAVESLIKNGFAPTRSVILAFGFDEEASGLHGAGSIGPYLLEKLGPDSVALLVDEGSGYSPILGQMYATPGVGEKGYIDVRVVVNTKGGHSSVPPAHTGIGILAKLITTLEAAPIPPRLTRLNPFFTTIQCVAAYSPDLPADVREVIRKAVESDEALDRIGEWVETLPKGAVLPVGTSLMSTTQAVDLIQGGVKANALPEQAWAIVNHRISVDAAVSTVQDHLTTTLAPVVDAFNLSFTSFGKPVTPPSSSSSSAADKAGSVVLEDIGTALEPAPITPSTGAVWDLLGGTIKAVYAHNDGLPASASAAREEKEKEIVLAPAIMSGNTDTRHYWALTRHIFRYMHMRPEGLRNGFHTVNEALEIGNFMGHIEFIATLVMNVDEAVGI